MSHGDDTERRLQELESKVWDLQGRLETYHAGLEASLEHDRKFQLRATWGVMSALGLGAFAGTYYLMNKWLGGDGIIVGAIAALVALLAYGAVLVWIEKAQKSDEGKLSRLPEWDNVK